MNTINVKKIDLSAISADKLSAILDESGVEFHSISTVNWEEYPYKPSVQFRIAHTDKAILLNYQVNEKSVRACCEEDNSMVWSDSCVEFFIIPQGTNNYYNVESTCIGTVLLGSGLERDNRQHAPQSVMDQIQRWSSLGRLPFEERIGDCAWELSLVVPLSSFFLPEIKQLSGQVMRGNFYKCGDELVTPHFLSWNPIKTETPNFHQLQFFGEFRFE